MRRHLFPIVIFIFLAMPVLFLTTPTKLLFYDAPEYAEIVSGHSLLSSIPMGHWPIHPGFIFILWIVSRFFRIFPGVNVEYSLNLSALFFGFLSLVLVIFLSRKFLSPKKAYIATLIYFLFPSVWLISTNLLVEPVLFFVYLLALAAGIFYLSRPGISAASVYIFSSALLVLVHIQGLFWIPALFTLFLLHAREKKITHTIWLKLCLISVGGIFLAMIGYGSVFYFNGSPVISSVMTLIPVGGERLLQWSGIFSLLRYSRNMIFGFSRGFGTVSLLLLGLLFIRLLKNKRSFFMMLPFAFSLLACGYLWSGDFMPRRLVFASIILSILFVRYFRKIWLVLIPYLFVMVIFHESLYVKNRNDMPIPLMQEQERMLVPDGVLMQTHYVRPFTVYPGQVLFSAGFTPSDVTRYLSEGKTVYFESQAVTAPYYFYTGNTLHVTSAGKIGNSDLLPVIKQNVYDLVSVINAEKRIFVYKLKDHADAYDKRVIETKKLADAHTDIIIGKAVSGSAVVLYSEFLPDRLSRERIDYGDVFSWGWSVFTDVSDPLVWTYADKSGVFMIPIPSNEGSVRIKGMGIGNSYRLSLSDIKQINQ